MKHVPNVEIQVKFLGKTFSVNHHARITCISTTFAALEVMTVMTARYSFHALYSTTTIKATSSPEESLKYDDCMCNVLERNYKFPLSHG